MLDAIARSNGTRDSVRASLLATKVSNGLLGTFSIDRNGDTNAGTVTIYRIAGGNPKVARVLTPARALVNRH
jgi:ABC-type branched-subunit amino acid transport system substrate-binding protein